MSFTDGKPWTVVEADMKRGWGGGKNGKNFRCTLCGRKFAIGDIVRWQHCTDRGHVNLLVCEKCDAPPAILSDRFMALYNEFKSDRFWYFRHQISDE